jgi:putative ABC transport system permease protein
MLEYFPPDQIYRLMAALVLVILAALISRWQKLDLEKDLLTASVRAFVQLIAIGYALTLIFAINSTPAILSLLAVMTLIAGYTAGKRGQGVRHSGRVALLSIGFGAALTLGLLVGLGVFEFTAQQIVPIGGMVIGNSMNVCSLVMGRVRDEINGRVPEIEAALALGATGRKAAHPYMRTALHAGMTPIIDSTKTVGLIQLPGAMTGMILAGASPLDAVKLQIIVMYMLIGAAAFTGLAAVWLTYRQFFTVNQQLVQPSS